MPVTNTTLNNSMYDNLYAQGYDPDPLDSIGKEAGIDDADVFRIHFTDKQGNDDQAWMAIVEGELILWADNNFISVPKYENFNKFWKKWAQQQTLRWNVTNRDRLMSDMKKRTAMKKKEDQLNEGYYALGKQKSYSDSVPTVKLIIQHTRQLEEGEQRFRNIAKIFVENSGGERFLLPTNRPGLARVFARHIAEGGTPYDDKGCHIASLVEDYTKMAGFVRATRNGQFNESALKLVNEGLLHYNNLRMTLQGMTSHRGYNKYFESYTPMLNEEVDDDTTLNELFVQETLDPRIESVMPILKRLSKNINEMSEVKELSDWASSITEGDVENAMAASTEPTKDIESNAEKAVNDAEQDVLKEIEDETTKTLAEPAEDMLDEAPGAMTLKHNQNTEKSNLKAFDLAEGPADEPVEPDMDSDDKRWDDIEESGLQAYLGNKKYGKEGMDALRKAGRDGASKEKMASIRAKYDKLDEEGVAEAAKWRDPKYKDKLYTQEPGDSDDYDNIGYGYDFPERPENDPGQKRRMGGVGREFDHTDPLKTGQGIGRSGIKHSLNLAGKRKGLPSRDQITSLKGSIKDAHGKHRKPNLPEQGDGGQEELNPVGIPEEVDMGQYDAVKSSPKGKDEDDDVFKRFREKLRQYGDELEQRQKEKEKEKEVDEGLDANQKRVGQLGPTEKVKNNNIGKLVGANESKLHEMDSEGYKGHRGDEDKGKGPEKTVKPAKAKDVAKDAEKALNKSMDKAHKKDVKEGQEDLEAILRIVRK